MDAYLLSAFLILFVLYSLVWMRGMNEEFSDDAAIADYKSKVLLMFAKYGKGQPIDLGTMDGELVSDMFKDFLILFNEFQGKVNGKPVGQADVQSIFPLDFLNEYNASVSKR